MSSHTLRIARLVLVASAFALTALCPRSSAAESVLYRLEPESEFQEGCQEGCACPLTMMGLAGSLRLAFAGPDGDFDRYDVQDVAWTFQRLGSDPVLVTGSGTLWIRSGANAAQRVELDLTIAGDPPVHFDSGLVAGSAAFPQIQVAVARNAFFCWDNVFVLDARPDATVSAQRITWSAIKALVGTGK